MNIATHAALRRTFVLAAVLAAVVMAGPASAAGCNANPKAKIDPLNEQVTETTAGVPTVVRLNGSTSTAGNDTPTFAWQFVSSNIPGYTPVLTNATSAIATFPAPAVPAAGASIQFRLTVTCGSKTDTATTNINVADVVVNSAPTAVASATPASAHEGDLVTLNGAGSFDLDAGTTLTYLWEQIGGTPTVTLANANASGSIVTFSAPNTPVETGASLTFRLTVSDGSLTGSTNQIVNVLWANDPPVTSLVCPGGLFTVDEGDAVTLDGSASSDSDGSITAYAWDQDTGLPNLGIGGFTTPSIQFTAPALGYNQVGGLTITLTTTDNIGAATSASCGLFIRDVTPPVITGATDQQAEATSPSGAVVDYAVAAQDAVDDEFPHAIACTPASHGTFPLGSTTVQCAASDSANNQATASFHVTVVDSIAPVLQAHDDVAVEATGSDGAIVTFDDPIATDAGDAAPAVTCVPASGSTFALGGTTVTCGAVDGAGNAAQSISFAVNVHDTIAPVVTPPADVVAEATGPQTVVAHGTATASDAVGVASIGSDAPADFPVGVTTIHWTAIDTSGNAGHADSLVTVTDTTPPTIEGHAAIDGFEATGPDGAAVTYASPATHDLVDGTGTATCAPASGSTFALGSTAVTCQAQDAHGNNATPTVFDVTVVDTTAPLIDAMSDITGVEATSHDGAVVSYTSPATHDIVDPDGVASCTPVSGATFALGTTQVTCTASDAHGNAADPVTFDVTVVDTTPPVIDPHANITGIEATGPGGAPVTYASPATLDSVDGPGVATCTPASGATFPLGVSTVQCSAQDDAGNTASSSFTVQVVDTTPPVIAAHANVGPIEATSAAGAVVSYSLPVTSDAVDGPGTASCSPLSGSTFALGDTTVACSAVDQAGNTATITYFNVAVRDTTAPVIAGHGPVVAEATGPAGAIVSYGTIGTSDAVDGAGQATCLPASGSTFALGDTTVTCHAQDAAGNTSTPTQFTVTVQDTTAPVIAAHADIAINATANSSVPVTYTLPLATDAVDGTDAVVCVPASGTSFTVGTTIVNCSATDNAHNVGHSSFKVVVSYAFNGFYRPVDNLPTVNTVKAGSAVPVKFSLGGNQGLEIFATGFPASVATTCGSTATDAIEETVTAGGSSLTYDATSGQYTYVWKTEKSWTGCRQLQVKLRDGSSRWAAFSFTR